MPYLNCLGKSKLPGPATYVGGRPRACRRESGQSDSKGTSQLRADCVLLPTAANYDGQPQGRALTGVVLASLELEGLVEHFVLGAESAVTERWSRGPVVLVVGSVGTVTMMCAIFVVGWAVVVVIGVVMIVVSTVVLGVLDQTIHMQVLVSAQLSVLPGQAAGTCKKHETNNSDSPHDVRHCRVGLPGEVVLVLSWWWWFGVPRRASNGPVSGDTCATYLPNLPRRPLKIRRWPREWHALRLSQMTGTKGWVAGLSKALQAAGYAFQPQHLHSIDIGQLQSLLRGGWKRIWDDLDICPRTAPSQGARKCTYARWFRKPFWAGTSPLTLPLTHAAMQRLLRFRTGCHGLPKDIGSQSGVPRHQRVCQLCGTGFGDELHLVFVSVQQWQICVANFQIFFSHIRRCSNSCGSQICCRLPSS